jgi:hypothetical protein
MRFENADPRPHDEATRVIEDALRTPGRATDANRVLVGLALHDEDPAFVERWCRRIVGESPDADLVQVAVTCLGHIARRFGDLAPESLALLHELAGRPDAPGTVEDALDDVEVFLGRNRPGA